MFARIQQVYTYHPDLVVKMRFDLCLIELTYQVDCYSVYEYVR